jgi:hypothetical protein
MSVKIVADALAEKVTFFQLAPEASRTAARIALNDVASRGGMKLFRDAIARQVNFPSGYVSQDSKRLYVSRRAFNDDLEVRLAARQRPTSLARFATGSVQVRGGPRIKAPPFVRVKPGGGRTMKGAFLIRLRAGSASVDEKYNVGLAIRLKPGERIRNKRVQSSVQLGHNLYLLYGPSVDQILLDVADEVEAPFLQQVSDQFTRQFVRLTNGGL